VDGAGAGSAFAAEGSFTSTVDVADAASARVYFVLATANPALGPARFRFGLPVAGRVQLSVYDLAGRRVATLVDRDLPAGHHVAAWGPDGAGRARPPGVYFARFVVGGHAFTRRIVVLR
jgi:hypothetical protein